jgi:hypothetical protein
MKNELKTLQDRMRWVKAVLGEGAVEDSLENLKGLVDVKSLKSPCEMFKELQLLATACLDVQSQFLSLEEECSSQDQLKAALAQLKKEYIPFKSILGSPTKAAKDWHSKLASMKRVEEQEAKARGQGSKWIQGRRRPWESQGRAANREANIRSWHSSCPPAPQHQLGGSGLRRVLEAFPVQAAGRREDRGGREFEFIFVCSYACCHSLRAAGQVVCNVWPSAFLLFVLLTCLAFLHFSLQLA